MPSAGPDWIIKGEERTAHARGMVLSPGTGGATVRDAEDEITGHRDAGLTAVPLSSWTLSVAKKADGLDHVWLKPLSPSIGTVIHGVDCAIFSDLETPSIRHTWLERKAVFFRGQGHLSHVQLVEFAQHFGELGGTHDELENEPGSELAGSTVKWNAVSPKSSP